MPVEESAGVKVIFPAMAVYPQVARHFSAYSTAYYATS